MCLCNEFAEERERQMPWHQMWAFKHPVSYHADDWVGALYELRVTAPTLEKVKRLFATDTSAVPVDRPGAEGVILESGHVIWVFLIPEAVLPLGRASELFFTFTMICPFTQKPYTDDEWRVEGELPEWALMEGHAPLKAWIEVLLCRTHRLPKKKHPATQELV